MTNMNQFISIFLYILLKCPTVVTNQCESRVVESKYGNGFKIETTFFYNNCELQYKETEYQDEHRVTYKLEKTSFRQNGNKRWEALYLSQNLSSFTRYNNEGDVSLNKRFTYDFCGELLRIDIERGLDKKSQTFETNCQNIYR